MHVEEPAAESFLYSLWERGIAGRRFRTTDGRFVEVLSPGRRNTDAGPDYRDAAVRIDGRVLRGDIEFHPLVDDWERHGHHLDPRYNNVILHFVTSGCPAEARTLRQDGAAVPIVDLDRHLPEPAELLEQAGLPKAPDLPEPCWLAGQPPEVILQVVDRASRFRLAEKAARFREQRTLDDWDQIIYRGILEALGYAKNQTPARALADRLPVRSLWQHTQAYDASEAISHVQAWLLGAAGLLDAGPPVDSPSDTFLTTLQRLWEGFPDRAKIDPLPPQAWTFFRLRPSNFPTRRLAAAAVLVVRFRQHGFADSFTKLLRTLQRSRQRPARELEKLLTVESFGFWNQRDCFLTGKPRKGSNAPQLLGKDRARDIAVNVVLPTLAAVADETDDGRLRATVNEIYRTYPHLPDNEILRTMRRRLLTAPPHKSTPTLTAAQQQGLIYLYKNGCQRRACGLCAHLANRANT
ncbi:MAG: DUF2851 family protein [Calditrichaeota bacterium]|nr:DUF2851 family protein [Calditrichota bacterium]